jgi:hypothetical protein
MKNRLMILVPVYEDWRSFGLLLAQIDEQLANSGQTVSVLAVDDGSIERPPDELFRKYQTIAGLNILCLKVNVGHQRAIAIGLSYIQEHLACDRIVIMDADGEDRPADIPALLAKSVQEGEQQVVFAQRAARSESWMFQMFYGLYRLFFRVATGRSIRFGNFSLIPASQMNRVVAIPDIWNNYPAALVKARVPLRMVACDRGARLAGKSKMGLVGLILHGLSAISVYSEIFGARALVASLLVMLVALALGITATVIRLATNLSIPGWATYAVGLSIVGVLQAFTLTMFFVFLILHSRNATSFVPGRDYEYFVRAVLNGPEAKN